MTKDDRRRRLGLLGAVALPAVAVVAVLIVVSRGGEDEPGGGLGGGGALSGARAADELFAGVPQRGAVLGDPAAPARLVEFVDLQCPFCAQSSADVLPTVVEDYVRTGRLSLELQPIAFIGDDSVRGAAAAGAAAQRDRMWQFVDVFFRNQGAENSGFATDRFVRRVADAAGLDPGPVVAAARSGRATPLLRRAAREADRLGVESTPTFFVVRDGRPQRLAVDALTPEAFTEALDKALRAG